MRLSMNEIIRTAACWVVAACLSGLALPATARNLLTTHVPAIVARHAVPVTGVPDPRLRLQLDIALPLRDSESLTATLNAIYDPASPSWHRYLSVAEFTARFGAAENDYRTAVDFFRTSGLRVTGLSANRLMIEVEGTVADIERVFHVNLLLYKHPLEARSFMAPDREPTLDLGVPILHVTGLDDLVLPAPRVIPPAPPPPHWHGTGSGPHGYYYGSDLRAAYYGETKLAGKGQSVGLMELVGYNPADVKLYFDDVKQPLHVPVKGISTDGKPWKCLTCNDVEQALDIEYAISMAPGLKRVQVYVGHSPESVLNRMASDDTSLQLSTSWGWGRNFDTDDALFREMAVQGQTFLTASGDASSLRKSGPWPEEDANLVAVGGTDVVTTGPGGAWLSETGWSYSAGGPSLDRHIKIEAYQLPFINNRNDGSTTLRNVPDIAANANTDCWVCARGRCNGGWGGTSFASPMWAGYVALINEEAAANGQPPVGFLNPTLYTLADGGGYGLLFHDETEGKSGKYEAVKGYDLVTGLGSQNGKYLIDALGRP
ncbi:MAG TPA: S53 family peptidase [Rhizomicrobium sp.]|nr:S53 family peptidase [Rhizomicrobium sp.]